MADGIITLNQTLRGQYIANVVCFSNVADDSVELQALADALRDSYDTNVGNIMTDDWSLDSITVAFLGNDSVLYSADYGFTAGPLVGTNGTDDLPPTSPMLVSLIFAGERPNRGRMYISGIGEGFWGSGQYTTTVRTAFDAMISGWRDGIDVGTNTYFLRILRRPSAVFSAYSSNPVTTVISRANEGTQKRRRRGRS